MSRYGIKNNEIIIVLLTLSQSNGKGSALSNFPSASLGRHGRVFDATGNGTGIAERRNVQEPDPIDWGGISEILCRELVKKYNTAVVYQDLGKGATGLYYTGEVDPDSADWNILSSTVNGSGKNYNARLLDRTITEYTALKSYLNGLGYTTTTKICSVIGEKDSSSTTEADEYAVNFAASLAFLRTQLNEDFEVISLRVHDNFDPAKDGNATVRAAQATVANNDPLITLLTGSDSYPLEDDYVHYNYEGQTDLATDFLAVY
jgi:hypothetical protein